MAPPSTNAPINLRRRFAIASLVVITAIAIGLGWLMSHMLTQRMLQREGEVSMDFIQNLLLTDQSAQYLVESDNADLRQKFLGSMAHLASMSEPVRANAYRPDGTVVWSTDATLIGRNYPFNAELDEALRGQLVVHSGRLDGNNLAKDEHIGLAARTSYYVESYIPILDPQSRRVLGVMELYKVPVQLNAAIREALVQLWLACAASAIGLFMALYWTVARADKVMRDQQAQLAESQTLATAVELARAVAHNLRNPLASIRSCAELTIDDDIPESSRETLRDITDQVDRLEGWIRSFLIKSRRDPGSLSEQAQIDQVITRCIAGFQPQLARRSITISVAPGTGSPMVLGRPAELEQVLNTILSNGIEAVEDGGKLALTWSNQSDGTLEVQVTDTGPGIPADMMHKVFEPFQTGKASGLGVGLALGRRIAERMGGSLDLANGPQRGAVVTLRLPAMA
jgi:two-component system sensor histidine kinase HydH